MNKEALEQKIKEWISSDLTTVPPEIRAMLVDVSQTGTFVVEWPLLRAVLAVFLKKAIEECHAGIKEQTGADTQEKDDQEKVEMLQQLFSFTQPPLTLQRLCELILNGPKWHKNPRKLLRAIDKILHISSTYNEEDFEKEASKERAFIPLRLTSSPPPLFLTDPSAPGSDATFSAATVFPGTGYAPAAAFPQAAPNTNTPSDTPADQKPSDPSSSAQKPETS